MQVVRSYYTPLRYPGGKAKLAPFVKELMKANDLIDGHYVEPFAGGAGIAIELLLSGYAFEVHLNDIDPGVHAFWYAVKNYPDEICRRISTSRLTIPAWKRHRNNHRRIMDPCSLDLGYSFLFLNRTNRSGIINGGVIGGIDQTGPYKIDARFNRKELIRRIEKIAYFGDRVHLYNLDALSFLDEIETKIPKRSLIYLDPPYYIKGSDLYQNFYRKQDHIDLARRIAGLKHNWIVSYDNVPEIRGLYQKWPSKAYSIQYSAHTSGAGSEIMFFKDTLRIPE